MDKLQKFLSEFASGNVKKHELKDFIHANGFFSQSMMNMLSRDDAEKSLDKKWSDNTIQFTDSIPEGENIFLYEGIISQQYGKGERNRNGYKIDKNGWKFDEYAYNTAILLMHDMEKGVIGNMIKVGVVKEGLRGLFRVDINNVSDEGIKNQIKTGTLKASSTGSLVEEYKFEDTETGKSYAEEKAIEEYGDREVFLAYFGMSDKLILNITSSIMIETSLVSIGSNYKAVHSDTMSKYFTNLISNRMTPEQIAQLKNQQNAVDTTENKEGESPEGTEVETTTSENDVSGTEPTTVSENDTEEVVSDDTAPEGENQEVTTEDNNLEEGEESEEDTPELSEATVEDKGIETDENSLAEENKMLREQLSELQAQINTPVVNTSLSKSPVQETSTVVNQSELERNFVANIWNAKV